MASQERFGTDNPPSSSQKHTETGFPPSGDTDALKHDYRDPSLPAPSTSNPFKPEFDPEHSDIPPEKWTTTCMKCFYNKEDGTILGRTCSSWLYITLYTIIYLIFLMMYTMMFLYFTLLYVKSKSFTKFDEDPMFAFLTYSPENVELTGVPLAEHRNPLIWYRAGEDNDYLKYITALDEILKINRTKRDLGSYLGPCGQSPYGYGESPCILVKINENNWTGKPLEAGSLKAKKAPEEVQKWIERDPKKYWLHCAGYHDYDKEHLGKIKYYPDPPGFSSSLYPLKENSTPPVIAFQVSNFTLGISLTIECKLWFEDGFTSIAFMLYVSP